MMVPLNGRDGHQLMRSSPALAAALADGTVALPAEETMVAALRRETELRLSGDTLAALQRAGDAAGGSWGRTAAKQCELIESIQARVSREFGLGDAGPELLRCAVSLYPDCQLVKEVPHYVKYNRAAPGVVVEGRRVPDLPLRAIGGAGGDGAGSTSLLRYGKPGRPLLIAAGSLT